MKNKKERLRGLTREARHASPAHNAPPPRINPLSLYNEERKALIRILMDLGLESIVMDEDLTMAEIFAANHIEASKALDSPRMNMMRKRYGFFDISPDDSLGKVLEKMHKNRK